tara:strand:+ start:355 stop:540 length:186 start_codon:yes stop_codon:yes gene_type:complete
MENLSSVRMMAVRVFEGELQRMKAITGGNYDTTQKIVRQYMQERINDMTRKGHNLSTKEYR